MFLIINFFLIWMWNNFLLQHVNCAIEEKKNIYMCVKLGVLYIKCGEIYQNFLQFHLNFKLIFFDGFSMEPFNKMLNWRISKSIPCKNDQWIIMTNYDNHLTGNKLLNYFDSRLLSRDWWAKKKKRHKSEKFDNLLYT